MFILPLLLAALAAPPEIEPGGLVFNGRARELTVKIPRLDATIVVDGALNEPVWASAALLNGFSQYTPQDGIPAADSTQVLVWYSPTAIHFGIRAFQPRDQVHATLADRDKISQDDYIQILLSTFNDGRQATVFMANPLGVQADGILVEQGTLQGGGFTSGAVQARETPDLSPDYVFQSKGRLTDFGYEIEIRIPFKSLKYQSAAVQTWGINVVRKVQYRGYEYSWAPARRAAASFLAQSGTLEGLTDLDRGLVMEVTPELTQRTEGLPDAGATTPGAWRYAAQSPKLGATVRWGITNNLTLNGTANPDFSQVEADAAQITFDPRQALSFPEKRPFFLDGLEQFSTPNSLVYTRRLVQPVAAAKLAGKVAGSSLAFLSAVDAASASTSGRDNPVFNIVRLQRDVGRQSRLGLVYTDRENGANWNRVLGVDGRLVSRGIYAMQFQLVGSATQRRGVRTNAPLWDARFNRSGKTFGWTTSLNGIADDFITESGFISRTGQVHANAHPRYAWFGARGAPIEQFSADMLVDGLWAYRNFFHSGDARDKKLHFNFNAQLRGGWTAGAYLLLESFGYDPAFYNRRYRIEQPRAGGLPSDTLAFTGTPRLPNRDWVFSLSTPQTKFLSFTALYIWGQDENFYEWSSAHIRYWSLSADVRASEQLRIGATYVLNDISRRTDGTRAGRQRDPRVKVEYQVMRNAFVRVIGEYFSDQTDVLRDDSRTNLPLLVYDAASAQWVRTVATTRNSVHTEFLFSYKPTPGTVFYAGYGANLTEPEVYGFRTMTRRNDAFYMKASYLWRL
ncbi:MAG TPA: DUF5916 domain-containing protein [Gemmatimonadaceae bacterium]|nr:DUF5916 domain-containing protein [Gemmatimonadaceae bacterium]